MEMDGHGQNEWKWLKWFDMNAMAGNGWKWLELLEWLNNPKKKRQEWLEMSRKGWKWLEIAGNGWNGWK